MEITEELLWDYAEGFLSEDERKQVEIQLSVDASLKKKLEEIKLLSSALGQMETAAPSMRFTRNVMEAWDVEMDLRAHPLKTHTNKWLIGGIAAFLGLSFLAICGIIIVQVLNNTNSIITDENTRLLNQQLDNFTKNLKFSRYFYGIILLLAFLFIERFLHYRNFMRKLEGMES